MRDLQPVVNAAHQQALFAPVKLDDLAQLETQRHEGMRGLAGTAALCIREVRHCAVTACLAGRLDLRKQRRARAPVFLLPWPSVCRACSNSPAKALSLPNAFGLF